LRRVLKRELEIEVLGLNLTVKRIILLAVMVCLMVLVGLMVSDLVSESSGGPPYNLTERNETTGLYEQGKTSTGLCVVFIFLALVLMYFILVEVRS
jgi:hypothetical protein